MIIAVKLLTWMASPTGVLVWGLSLAALLRILRKRGASTLIGGVAILQLMIFSFPVVSDGLLNGIENQARTLEAARLDPQPTKTPKTYGAIVVLGGAIGPAYPPKRMFPDLNDASDRVWHAARLFKQGIAPRIIACGGKGPGLEGRNDFASESATMRELLVDLGIPKDVIVLEEQSRTTRENAAFALSLIGEQRVALVTSAFHMPRAYATFKKAGVAVDAYPTDFRSVPETGAPWEHWLPTASSLQRSEMALKEYLALLLNY